MKKKRNLVPAPVNLQVKTKLGKYSLISYENSSRNSEMSRICNNNVKLNYRCTGNKDLKYEDFENLCTKVGENNE